MQRHVRNEMRKAHNARATRERFSRTTAEKYQTAYRSKAEAQVKEVLGRQLTTAVMRTAYSRYVSRKVSNTSNQRLEPQSADMRQGMAIKNDWEKLDLSDVQPVDLERMDLTGLPPSLIEHAEHSSLDYTEEERKVVQMLLEKESVR